MASDTTKREDKPSPFNHYGSGGRAPKTSKTDEGVTSGKTVYSTPRPH